jgi:radical SAM PhpK family P-methyltransferase
MIDCLFIGHYEMECETHIQQLKMSPSDINFRGEFNQSFVYYNNKAYYGSDLLNLFSGSSAAKGNGAFFDIWRWVSLTIAYLGSYLHRRGYSFDYVNSFNHGKQELARKLEQENIRVIAITTTYYVSYFPMLEIVRFVREHNRTAKIVIGGPFVSNQAFSLESLTVLESLFELIGADIYVNSAQGEATLVKLIDALKQDTPLDRVNNIYYRNGKGYLSTPVVLENNRLSENPVDWQLFAAARPGYVNVRTSISCPFKCSFCGFRIRAGNYQGLEVEQIEEELNRLNTIETMQTVHFIDDTINTPAEKFKRFLGMLLKNKYRFKWLSWLRCHNVDREMVEMMKESGCIGVFIGFESGNNRILENMNKGITIDKYFKGISLLKEYGILMYGSFIIGFPGETEETAADTVRFIEESKIDFFGAKVWFLEPFSSIMKEKEKYRITGSQYDWSHNTMNSKQACDIREQAFLNIKNSIPLPEHQFHFFSILHLVSMGMKPGTLKSFIKSFNRGVRDRILGIGQNIRSDIAAELKHYARAGYLECNGGLPLETAPAAPEPDGFDVSFEWD